MNKCSKLALIVIVVMMVGVFFVQGCARRDDGMGDLWIGVQHMDKQR
jgi:hypothetical protein